MNQSSKKIQDIELGIRLKEERNRLKFNQIDFASIGGVSKGSQILYEKGSSAPSNYMSAIAAAGADVQYILTGVRSMPIHPTSPEEAILMLYRGMTPSQRADCMKFFEEKKLLNELQSQADQNKKAGNE